MPSGNQKKPLPRLNTLQMLGGQGEERAAMQSGWETNCSTKVHPVRKQSLIYIWPHSGSQPSFTPEIHLSSPLKHLSVSHPTQGSAGTPLPAHTPDLSSQTNFPSQQACSTPAVCQATARSTYHGYFN